VWPFSIKGLDANALDDTDFRDAEETSEVNLPPVGVLSRQLKVYLFISIIYSWLF
jgi:hypothetical protein